MGSGHFLVSLVDYLADGVIAAMAEAEALANGYVSPLVGRIQAIRDRIVANAEERNWAIDLDRLDDRHIIRRMVLKRCVFGVDKNPMAVELAKVALWLHTFTVGAPLSFLDHHLRCGDSLFGAWARGGIDKAIDYGGPLLLHGSVTQAERSALGMQTIEELTDAEIAEAHRSAETFAQVEEATAPLDAVLSLVHAIDWLEVKDRDGRTALQSFFGGLLGDPIEIALGRAEASAERPERAHFAELLREARRLVDEERFLNWQAAFPGVWTNWQSVRPEGGFDAVIGNPPWDRMKLQQVEWFATRRRGIAMAPRAADRKRMIAALERAGDPLALDYALASERATASARVARRDGRLSVGCSGRDLNLYSLFVERAMTLVKRSTALSRYSRPHGIAPDQTASRFFKGLATEGRQSHSTISRTDARATVRSPSSPTWIAVVRKHGLLAGPANACIASACPPPGGCRTLAHWLTRAWPGSTHCSFGILSPHDRCRPGDTHGACSCASARCPGRSRTVRRVRSRKLGRRLRMLALGTTPALLPRRHFGLVGLMLRYFPHLSLRLQPAKGRIELVA